MVNQLLPMDSHPLACVSEHQLGMHRFVCGDLPIELGLLSLTQILRDRFVNQIVDAASVLFCILFQPGTQVWF